MSPMLRRSWAAKREGRGRTPGQHRSSWRASVEPLEDRCLPSSLPSPNVDAPFLSQRLSNGDAVFMLQDASGNWNLWRSDGTSQGTTAIANFGPNTATAATESAVLNGDLYFFAIDPTGFVYYPPVGAPMNLGDREALWKTDGTPAGTSMVADINPTANGYIDASGLINVAGTLYFAARNADSLEQLWKSDGTAAGTVMLTDIDPQVTVPWNPLDPPPPVQTNYGFQVQGLTNVNGTLFFAGDDRTHGNSLWKSDGTTVGTVIVEQLGGKGYGGQGPSELVNAGGTLYFAGPDSGDEQGLWRSDGTAAGTYELASFHGVPGPVTEVDGTTFFSADEALWKTDGTSAGTVHLTPLETAGRINPGELTNLNGTLVFAASDRSHGTELWTSDGTATGTIMVKDINPGPGDSYPFELTSVNGTVYFMANDGIDGIQLWRSDGTTAGTAMVDDINPYGDAMEQDQAWLANADGRLLFEAADGLTGLHLYSSQGTAGTTQTIGDFYFGSVWWPPAEPSAIINGRPPPTPRMPSEQQGFVPGRIAATGGGAAMTLFAVDSRQELFKYTPAGGWTQIGAAGTVESITSIRDTAGDAVLFAVTTDGGLSRYNAHNGWQRIGAAGTIMSASAGVDAGGAADVYVLTTANMLTEFRGSSGWLVSPVAAANTISTFAALANDRVVVVTGGRVAEYDPRQGWLHLSGGGPANVADVSAVTEASGQESLFARTADGSLWRYDASVWTQVGASGTIKGIAAGLDAVGRAVVFAATFQGNSENGLAELSTSGWLNLSPPSGPFAISTAGGEVFVFLGDASVDGRDDHSGFFPLTSPGFL